MTEKLETFAQFDQAFREILADLLVVTLDEVTPQALLVDDLDADSVSFLELTFLLKERFSIRMPEVKVDEQTLTLPLVDGLEKLNSLPGDLTFFEHVKLEALRRMFLRERTVAELVAAHQLPSSPRELASLPVPRLPLSKLLSLGLDIRKVEGPVWEKPLVEALATVNLEEVFPVSVREKLFRSQTVADLVAGVEGRVPDGMKPDTEISKLRLRDLFRFLTVGAMSRYLWQLHAAAPKA